jgi:hypothetical protein
MCPESAEPIPPGEAEAIAAILANIRNTVITDAKATGTARRDAHPKMHACVEAIFQIPENLPEKFRIGLFAAPHAYRALIRFSNGAPTARPDWRGDGRGMAIKLLDVPQSPSGQQDFICINHPVFFVRTLADYIDFQCKGLGTFLLPSLLPPRIRAHEAGIILAILLKPAANPLDMRYWSMTPYAFGDTACKFSMRPIGPPTPLQNRFRRDTFRENMAARLASQEAAFDVCIQLRTDPARMPIEDATIDWPEDLSPYIPVARITIPPQIFDTPQRRATGEALAFTPWHTLPHHTPLGPINRARRQIYDSISTLRQTLNHPPPTPP